MCWLYSVHRIQSHCKCHTSERYSRTSVSLRMNSVERQAILILFTNYFEGTKKRMKHKLHFKFIRLEYTRIHIMRHFTSDRRRKKAKSDVKIQTRQMKKTETQNTQLLFTWQFPRRNISRKIFYNIVTHFSLPLPTDIKFHCRDLCTSE